MKVESQKAEQKLHSTSLARSGGILTIHQSMIPHLLRITLTQAVNRATKMTVMRYSNMALQILGPLQTEIRQMGALKIDYLSHPG